MEEDNINLTLIQFSRILRQGTETEKHLLYRLFAGASREEWAPILQRTDDRGAEKPLSRWFEFVVCYGNMRLFRLFVEKGVDYRARSEDGCTILMDAAKQSTEILRVLLQKLNCDDMVNAQDKNGRTALHCGINNSPAVELLLQHGADPNARDTYDRTPLYLAAEYGNIQSAALLLEYGAKLNDNSSEQSIMHIAAYQGNVHFVQRLLLMGAEDMIIEKDREGKTPLDLLQPTMIDFLVRQYMIRIVRQESVLCLHWILRAAIYKKDKVVLPVGKLTIERMLALLTMFVSERPNLVSTGDDTGALPLHVACQYPKTPIQFIDFLVEQDPSTLRQTDNAGNLPIHTLCVSRPSMHKLKYLLGRHEESITALNQQGRSPFMLASLASASVEVLWYLMRADPGVALASLRRPL